MKTKLIIIFIFISCITVLVLGQNVKKKPVVQSIYLTSSFNKQISKIPSGFLGHNPQTIYKAVEIKSRLLSKDEFETTSNYEQRIIKEKNSPILGVLNEDSLFVFRSMPSNLYILDFDYNADNQELKLSIELNNFTNYKSKDLFDYTKKSIVLKNRTIKKYNYNGTNLFGVSKSIEYKESDEYCLLINNWMNFTNVIYDNSNKLLSNFTNDYLDRNITFKISVNSETAKLIKDKDFNPNYSSLLSFLYIGKIKPPYAMQGYYYLGPPTISEPYEYIDNIKYITMELEEIWVYNQKSGIVYSKILPH